MAECLCTSLAIGVADIKMKKKIKTAAYLWLEYI